MPTLRRLAAATLVVLTAAVAAPGPATAESFTPEQKSAIEALVRDYILQNPGVILESLAIMEARQRADQDRAQQQALLDSRDALERAPGDPVLGNPDGDVTIVEFFDYQCGYCKTMTPPLMELVREDGGIRVVMKEFPILGPDSVLAARVALAAQRQGKYEPLHLALMGLRGRLNEGTILQVAAETGLDLTALAKDMADPEIEARIRANYDLAQTLSIEGTPAFTIGGTLVPGAAPKERLAELVKKARDGG